MRRYLHSCLLCSTKICCSIGEVIKTLTLIPRQLVLLYFRDVCKDHKFMVYEEHLPQQTLSLDAG